MRFAEGFRKALLTPAALATLEPSETYHFCPDANCDVVYFSEGHVYRQADVQVPVYQKDPGVQMPGAVVSRLSFTRMKPRSASFTLVV